MHAKSAPGALPALRAFFKKYSIIAILVMLMVVLTLLKPQFIKTNNLLNVVRQVSLVGILAMGMMMVIINGGVDLSAGAQIAMTSVVCSLFANERYPLILAFLMPLIAGWIASYINGFLITVPKIPPFIATLGMANIARGFALLFSGGMPISDIRDEINWLGSAKLFGVPVLIYIFVACSIVVQILLTKTRFGKKVYALGGNEQAARVCGISVEKTRRMIYLWMGTFAALAGILITGRVASGSATNGVEYHLDAIAASVIGGVSMRGGSGNVFGVVIGVMIIGVLQNGLDIMKVSPYWQLIAKGIIIIAAVVADTMRKRNKT